MFSVMYISYVEYLNIPLGICYVFRYVILKMKSNVVLVLIVLNQSLRHIFLERRSTEFYLV